MLYQTARDRGIIAQPQFLLQCRKVPLEPACRLARENWRKYLGGITQALCIKAKLMQRFGLQLLDVFACLAQFAPALPQYQRGKILWWGLQTLKPFGISTVTPGFAEHEGDAGQQQGAPSRPVQRFSKTLIGCLAFRFCRTQQGPHAAIIRQKISHLRPDPGQKHIPIPCRPK